MAVSELNEDIQDQICDRLEYPLQIEKLENKDIRILLDKIVRKYGEKQYINEIPINPTIIFACFTKCCRQLPLK